MFKKKLLDLWTFWFVCTNSVKTGFDGWQNETTLTHLHPNVYHQHRIYILIIYIFRNVIRTHFLPKKLPEIFLNISPEVIGFCLFKIRYMTYVIYLITLTTYDNLHLLFLNWNCWSFPNSCCENASLQWYSRDQCHVSSLFPSLTWLSAIIFNIIIALRKISTFNEHDTV